MEWEKSVEVHDSLTIFSGVAEVGGRNRCVFSHRLQGCLPVRSRRWGKSAQYAEA